MKPLILAGEYGWNFERSGRTEAPATFLFRLVDGKLPSADELAAYARELTEKHGPGAHWSVYTARWHRQHDSLKTLSLVDVCRSFETVELWFDPAPNDQLQLVWLLDLLSSHPEVVAKLKVRLVDFDLLMAKPEELARWKVPAVEVTESEIETASMAWQAYRSATPEACFDLLAKDLSALPLLRPALLDLLEELPSYATGLGATEMRLLELIARGYTLTNALFYLSSVRQRRVFNTREIGFLLEGLAHGPNPAIAGLDDELRTLDKENERGRDEAYRRSFLSLTELGWAIVEHKEDFSRYNPIDRWWGGTRLTNDCLWRWNPALVAPRPSRPLSTFVPGPKTHPSREPL
ncbi:MULTISPECIES: hypothetical protein [unclassified Bradyrhizobium]|uniref:hypothetical protein n=1 Tax=unclassified Bradyrhizobium TaxID=2631580 RepID=UPI001BA7B7EF|nr:MULTISPECIES: hypothetical protein [unclassified Bradyrhizobium]MBR1153086.1 hypothetical protein [Bradyrhizobium sp. JYMT SZCCT0428]MBR1269218.1 hypothetical protein [Bradyrhizobium sp. AUGA SZCCT0222]